MTRQLPYGEVQPRGDRACRQGTEILPYGKGQPGGGRASRRANEEENIAGQQPVDRRYGGTHQPYRGVSQEGERDTDQDKGNGKRIRDNGSRVGEPLPDQAKGWQQRGRRIVRRAKTQNKRRKVRR